MIPRILDRRAAAVAFALLLTLVAVIPAQPQSPPAATPSLGRWYKGNTHTHTLNSDGDSTPDEVVRWYREHGYRFLVLTDHNFVTAVDGLNAVHGADEQFLVLKGEEVSDRFGEKPIHINGLEVGARVAPQGGTSVLDVVQRNVDAIRQVRGVPHINHPNYGWAITREELQAVKNNRLFEVFNGHPQVNNVGGGGVPGMDAAWDAILSNGTLLYGIAVDDAHTFKQPGNPDVPGPGRGWVVVRAPRLEPRALVDALERGDFYASTGVELTDYQVNARQMIVDVKATAFSKYRVQFIGKGARVLKEVAEPKATYDIRGDEGYVRARVLESNGRTAWCQPVVVQPRPASIAGASVGWLIVLTGACVWRRRPRHPRLLAFAVLAISLGGCTSRASSHRHLLIVVDGLRPDYVTPEVMPNLAALGRRGVVFNRHHSVYPTVTRVNASSISTGAYPEAHGLLGNSVYFPKVNATKFLDTADRSDLLKISAAEGRLLTATPLGGALQAAGRKMLVVSSGSAGSAFLNNHTVAGGAILHYQYVLPEQMEEEMKILGPRPAADASPASLDHYAIDAFLKVGVPKVDPAVTVAWLSGLDTVAHDKGIGDPATIEILRQVDGEIKRVQDGLSAAGLLDDYDIWVTSDHGFSTHTGAIDLAAVLKPFAGTLADGSPRLVSGGGAIYVRGGDESVVPPIVAALQHTPNVGAIFTRAAQSGSFDGRVPGTLSFDAIRWTHDRSAQILFSPDWTDNANTHGVRGTVAASGTAGHGSSSQWDIHNTLIAAGPDLKRGVRVDSPTANVDFAPTFLKLLGVAVPASMQGRPLDEALADGAELDASAVKSMQHTTSTPDGAYSLIASFSTVTAGGREYRYFDGTRVRRN